MIVVERDFIARWVRELKQQQDSGNRDYYTGYVTAMSTVEGMLAMCPEYDLGKLAEVAGIVSGENGHGKFAQGGSESCGV